MALRRFAPKHNFAGADFDGLLLAVTPSKYRIEPEAGASAGVMTADVVVCSGPRTGETHSDLRIIQLSLIDGLKDCGLGETTVFRLESGRSKSGNPLWIMKEPTDDDIAAAEAAISGDVATPAPAPARSRTK